MEIIDIKHIEDCFDGSYIRELIIDTTITKEWILSLNKGELKYYEKFAKPFFCYTVEDEYQVKGVEGNNSMRIWIKNKDSLNLFKNYISERR